MLQQELTSEKEIRDRVMTMVISCLQTSGKDPFKKFFSKNYELSKQVKTSKNIFVIFVEFSVLFFSEIFVVRNS